MIFLKKDVNCTASSSERGSRSQCTSLYWVANERKRVGGCWVPDVQQKHSIQPHE